MRVWIVTQDFPPGFIGGVASWAADLADALRAAVPVSVLARATPGAAEADRALPYPVTRVRGRSWAAWQGLWVALAGGGRLRRGDAVIFATWRLATLLGPVARARGARVAVAFHGSDLTQLASPPAAFRGVVDRADALFPVSGFLATELERLGLRPRDPRVLRLPMALPLPPPPPPGEAAGALVAVARPTPLKGLDRAARLAAALARPLVVVGAVQPDEATPGVRWLGPRSREETRALYGGAAAALLLPRAEASGRGAEGLGLCLLEAAAAGVPAIGCPTGGVPEAVGPGLVLRDPDALPEADLAAARRLLADPGAGAAARAWVEENHGPVRAREAILAALGGEDVSRRTLGG